MNMATLRQKKLARAIVENAKKPQSDTAGQMLEKVGYATSVAKHKPSEILEADGVQEELQELGFDPESAKKVVQSILTKGKEENRLKAADMIFKVHSTYAPEKSISLVATIDANNDAALTEAAKAYGLAATQRKVS